MYHLRLAERWKPLRDHQRIGARVFVLPDQTAPSKGWARPPLHGVEMRFAKPKFSKKKSELVPDEARWTCVTRSVSGPRT
jgi:hypothetical protein